MIFPLSRKLGCKLVARWLQDGCKMVARWLLLVRCVLYSCKNSPTFICKLRDKHLGMKDLPIDWYTSFSYDNSFA